MGFDIRFSETNMESVISNKRSDCSDDPYLSQLCAKNFFAVFSLP